MLRRIFAARGIDHREALDCSLGALPSPALFKDIDAAVARLLQAIDGSESILVLGDYDTDGATASALAVLGLRALGADDVDYLVPNRFDYGYGLSPEIARVAVEMSPSLVVTVDNGISSITGVDLLRQNGIDVIVTDHHLAGSELPRANAIINPNQPGCAFPSPMLAGVGVMFYLLLALRAAMRRRGDFADGGAAEPNLARFLDLVALGTVADVVPLDRVNRILASQGIARIQNGKCRPGIRALLQVAGKQPDQISSSDLGFVVAPRLNAAGRLEDIALGIECLLTDDESEARRHAETLHAINLERRDIEQRMQQQALSITADLDAAPENDGGYGICLYSPDWHQGLTGLVASRLKDRYFQPVIAFAPAGDGRLTGSARSLPGLHIRDLLADISALEPTLMEKFGGHAMAAGMTIREERLEQFRDCFRRRVTEVYADSPPSDRIDTDGPLEDEFFTREIAEMLRAAAPWGQHFPAPLFDNEFSVIACRIVGEQHLKLRLRARGKVVDAIAFRMLQPGEPAPELDRIRAVYQLDVNHFRGERSLQLIIEHLEPVVAAPVAASAAAAQRD